MLFQVSTRYDRLGQVRPVYVRLHQFRPD